MKVLAVIVLLGIGTVLCEKKRGKGGGYVPKTALECFGPFDKENSGNCMGGFIASCQDCDLEKCAQKCFLEHRSCKGFSYSNHSSPACVIKDIAECEDPEKSDYVFYQRDPECDILPTGLYPTSYGCAFAEVSQRCDDAIKPCTDAQCSTQEGCKNHCLQSSECHGAIFDTTVDTCATWLGRNCTKPHSKHEIEYYEKYCGEELEKFEKKRLDEYQRQCTPKCPSIPLPRGAIHNGGSTNIGEVVTFLCLRGSIEGPRMIKCVPDGEYGAKWVPYKSSGLSAEPRCTTSRHPSVPLGMVKKSASN